MSASNSSVLSRGVKLAAPRSLYFLIFAVSGFSGLIYESIWSHYLKLFLGHAAYAQSLVLIIFMGGMALGSWLASRYTVNKASPLLLYAGVELVVGLAALAFHGLFTSIIESFYSTVLPSIEAPLIGNFLKWLAASTLIMPQSVLLGMTFPLMSAGIIRRFPETPGGSIAMLYFTNSIGAAIGVLVSGFWLIKLVGLPGTIFSAGLLNVVLAMTVWVLLRLDPQSETAPIRSESSSDGWSGLKQLFLVAAFVTGAASFIYEISWIRMLSLVLGSTTHSFELMLSAFITGLAFGGLWIKRRIDRIESPVRFSGYVQLIMGGLAVLTLPVYVNTFGSMEWLLSALRPSDAGFAGYSIASHAIALSVMLPTTFMAGMTLPLFTYVLIQKGFGEASIGQVYAANTVGAIVGVLFAVHIGLPLLGLKWLVVVGALFDIVLGLVLLWHAVPATDRRTVEMPAAALLSLAVVALTVGTTSLEKEVLVSGVYRTGQSAVPDGDRVVYYRDGKTSTVALTAGASGYLSLSTNGKPDAAINVDGSDTYNADETTMTLLGALPIAYLPGARSVANIGMGSGMTTHTLLGYEGVRRVDTVEIEPAMVEAAAGFGAFVERAFTDARSRIHIEDAKTYFSLNNSVYDIIVAEPSNPWVSGVASLFSTEFYATVKKHIREGGLFLQWIQRYEFNNQLAESILKALTENFSDYVIYTTNGVDLVLIARNGGAMGEPDWQALFSPQVAPQLARYGVKSAADIRFRQIVDRDSLLPMLRLSRTPVNSDYYPYVDLHAGQARFKHTMATMFENWTLAPLPLTEMLLQQVIDYDSLSGDSVLARAAHVRAANWQYERIVNNVPVDDEAMAAGVNPDVMALANVVRDDVHYCETVADANRFAFALHDVMADTLPFLSADKASRLVDTVRSAECVGVALARRDAWLTLYSAVARRDPARMLDGARDLLASDIEVPAIVDEYLVAAALLGAQAAGRGDEAAAVWEQYGEPIYESKEMPDYMRLLASIALDNGARVASSK